MSDPIKRIELEDGTIRYRFVVDVGRNPLTGMRKQITRTFDKKKDAIAEYERIKHTNRDGSYVAPNKLTVEEWLDTWLKSAVIDVEAATARSYRNALRVPREQLGKQLLQRITEDDMDDLVDFMLTVGRKKGGKPGTPLGLRSVTAMLGRMRAVLDEAVHRKLVGRNVAERTKIPRAAREAAAKAAEEREPWDEQEVKTFLMGIRNDRLFAVMLLSLLGMRPAEVCGLRWDKDVDLDKGTLAVGDNTRTVVGREVVEKGAKSEKGKRKLPLPGPALAALKAFKAVQAAEKLKAGEAYTASGYVVVDMVGVPMDANWLRRRAYGLMDKTGVRRVRLYDARHACLTYLAGAGVPDVVVSAWAGHADLSFTKRTYIHPNAEHLREAADKLSELLG